MTGLRFLRLVAVRRQVYVPLIRSMAALSFKTGTTTMAAFDAQSPSVAGHVSLGRFGSFFSSALADFRAWNAARKTKDLLSRLTDRELDDIGLVRGDIARIADQRYMR